jgi:transposase
LNTPRSPLVVTADKAYDSQTARQQIKDGGALPIIPNRRNAIKQAYCPKRFYRQRDKIENFFCRIKDWRRIAKPDVPISGIRLSDWLHREDRPV